MKLFPKYYMQQSMKYMVVPSEYNDSVVEFDGSGKSPPLLPSSCSDGLIFHVHQ